MKAMLSYITIGGYEFNNCSEFTIKQSWKTITQTATIKLHNIAGLIDKIKVGDKVEIFAAYDDKKDLYLEFKGYVAEINPNLPVEVKCECAMWKLKQETVSHSWRSTTLKQVLTFLVPQAVIDCPSVTLAPFRLNNVTKAKALQTLKDEYLLTVYYRNDTLFVGLPYTEKGLGNVDYHFQKNVPSAQQQGNLTFKRKEDIKIKVKAISIQPDNKRIEKEFGDDDGDSTTLHFHNKKESELVALAKEQLNRMKYDGYRGDLIAFGQPISQHGMIANIYDDRFPERQSSVFIDGVTVEYSSNGYKRINQLGRKVVREQ